MPTMIFAHPRSRSTLMAHCFENDLGEVFNLSQINPKTFQIEPGYQHPKQPWTLWKSDWTREYLQHLEQKLSSQKNAVFKVFYEHILPSPEAHALIHKLNPRVLAIYRKDSSQAVKSILLAGKKGFNKAAEKEIQDFTVTPAEVFWAYSRCVWNFRLGLGFFKPEFLTTYEEFDVSNFRYKEKEPALENQNSAESFRRIKNEKQVDDWVRALAENDLCR